MSHVKIVKMRTCTIPSPPVETNVGMWCIQLAGSNGKRQEAWDFTRGNEHVIHLSFYQSLTKYLHSADELRSTDWYRTLTPNRKETCSIFSLRFFTLMSCGVTPLLIFNYSP
jgi:hypothetical protein